MKIRQIIPLLVCSFSALTFSAQSLQFVFKESEYSYQALRAVGAAVGGAADIGECLVTCLAIKEGDDESWYTEWFKIATRLENEARASQKAGHLESARTAFMRASNYYRSAEFFLHIHPKDPRILETWGKSRACFREAVKNQTPRILEVRIPFENTTLPGYLCLADSDENPRPLVIIQTGFDGTAEELYYTVAEAGVKRGYHCLIFEGPGQGEAIRVQNIPFRYNWETVIIPVVDYALNLKQVDKHRIALMGLSMGGYLVPRALAFEHRVKVGIANGGVYDFHAVIMQNEPPGLEEQLDDPEAEAEINAAIEKIMTTNSPVRWAFGQGMYTFHAKTPVDWLKMTRPYNLRGVAQNIKAKMLIVDSEHDFQMKGQAKQLYDALQSPKEFMLFKASEGAGEHCQVGASFLSNERIFNWLDDNL